MNDNITIENLMECDMKGKDLISYIKPHIQKLYPDVDDDGKEVIMKIGLFTKYLKFFDIDVAFTFYLHNKKNWFRLWKLQMISKINVLK